MEPADTARIRALPIWPGPIDIAPLAGGMTNRNYLVTSPTHRAVVRLGGDIPVHGVMRFNELAASRAAAAAGVSPPVLHAEPGILVLAFIDGRTLTPDDVRADRDRCVAFVARAHAEVARHFRGPALSFDVFRVIADYAATLRDGAYPHAPRLPALLQAAAELQRAAGHQPEVLAHNDLLAGNFIDDGARLWLIDWDYAGFGTPLFDLGGLAANNGFSPDDEAAMLEACYGAPDATLRRQYAAIKCAALLREALWSMVSELTSTLDVDYAAYTAENLARFDAAWERFQ